MKRLFVVAAMSAAVSSVHAEGYAGAILALTRLDIPCEASVPCDRKANGGRIYFGSRLSDASRIDLGVGAIDAVEFGYMKLGTAKTVGTATTYVFDPDDQTIVTPVTVPTTARTQSDALTIAAVMHFPVTTNLSFAARAGAAYVTTTVKRTQDGLSSGSRSESHLRPYVGLGVEFDIPQWVKVVGTFDATQFEVNGKKGSAQLMGLGLEKAF